MVKHDDYMTPFSAWEDVSPYIPRHLTLWEAFYGDGTSGHHLTELGFDVIHEDVDFFTHDLNLLSSESDGDGFDERLCERCNADISNQPEYHYLCYQC